MSEIASSAVPPQNDVSGVIAGGTQWSVAISDCFVYTFWQAGHVERDGCLSYEEAAPSLFQTLYRWFALLRPVSLIWGHDIHTGAHEDVHSLI